MKWCRIPPQTRPSRTSSPLACRVGRSCVVGPWLPALRWRSPAPMRWCTQCPLTLMAASVIMATARDTAVPAGDALARVRGHRRRRRTTPSSCPRLHRRVLIAWGDPVSNGPAFKQDASNTAAEQAQQWGMHNDGIVYFPINGSSKHGLLVQNHEYTDDGLLFPDGIANWTAEKTAKSQNAHGVGDHRGPKRGRRGQWEVVRPSTLRPTHHRPDADRRSPVRPPATRCCRPAADPTGTAVLGTLNNCAMGYTPWGTYLACEENFNGYFRKTGAPTPLEARYGISAAGAGYLLAHHRRALRRRRRAERAEPLRLGRRDRSVRPDVARRSSAPRSAASSTRARGCRRPATAASSSTWATTSASSTSTASSRADPWRKSAPAGRSTRSTTARCTSPGSTPTAPASGCR